MLKFQDGALEDPFLARYVSDGTIKALAYLTLLYDPDPHPPLGVEEPENQLYPWLRLELAEEFRSYADGTGVLLSRIITALKFFFPALRRKRSKSFSNTPPGPRYF